LPERTSHQYIRRVTATSCTPIHLLTHPYKRIKTCCRRDEMRQYQTIFILLRFLLRVLIIFIGAKEKLSMLLLWLPLWLFLGSVFRSGLFDFENLSNICDATGWVIAGGVPVKRATGRLIHWTATAWTEEGGGSLLTRYHVHPLCAYEIAQRPSIRLHNAPDATNFAKRNAKLTKRLVAGIPAVISDCQRATAPAPTAPSAFALISQLMQQDAARLIRSSVARIIGKMQLISSCIPRSCTQW